MRVHGFRGRRTGPGAERRGRSVRPSGGTRVRLEVRTRPGDFGWNGNRLPDMPLTNCLFFVNPYFQGERTYDHGGLMDAEDA